MEQDSDAADLPETALELREDRKERFASMRCRLGFHQAMPSNVWNDGHYFSACRRCKTQLIRTPQESWHPVPAHFRVVWRARTEDDISWPTHVV